MIHRQAHGQGSKLILNLVMAVSWMIQAIRADGRGFIGAHSRMSMIVALLAIWPTLSFGSLAITQTSGVRQTIEDELAEFHARTAEYMNRRPVKWRSDGSPLPSSGDATSVNPNAPQPGTRAPLKASDAGSEIQLESFLGEGERKFETLEEMERLALTTARAKTQPWSGDYWPIYAGAIARRYADPKFPDSENWKVNFDYLLGSLHSTSLDTMSPAEKYDVLVGDSAMTLTRTMIEEGRPYFESTGSVEAWMGLCHGWAVASYREMRPSHSVDVIAADGHTRLRFYPSDLKGLATALWANGNFEQRFIGGRCNDKNPPLDENGRIISPVCFDENPGTWHLAIAHLLGLRQESFVMDATFDFQVWNQPVLTYRYSYFNPQTRKAVPDIGAARVARATYTDDKFKKYRSDQAASFVGVAMEVGYISETGALTATEDAPENDAIVYVRYLYDLELDSGGRVIGGEWYKNTHPDFLWRPAPGSKVRSYGDLWLDRLDPASQWDGKSEIPAAWKRVIPSNSSRGTPLGRVVEALLLRASTGM